MILISHELHLTVDLKRLITEFADIVTRFPQCCGVWVPAPGFEALLTFVVLKYKKCQ